MPTQTMEEVKSALQLTQQEAKTLHRCELVIESGLKTFHQVGQALLTVREGKLWRAEYKSFEDYCDKRFSISRNYGTRLMSAAETVANLENSVPIGTVLPATESQTRPLSQLPAEEQGEAWAEVQKRAEESKKPVTAAAVQAVVAERLPKTIKDLLPVGSFVLTRYSSEPYVIAAHEVYGDHTTLRSNMFWEFKERFGEAPNAKKAGWLNGCRIEDGKVMSGNEELLPISRENAEWLYKNARVTGHYWSPDQVKGYNRLVLSLGKPEWIKKEEEPAPPKAKTSKRQPEVEIISPVSQVPPALPEPPQTLEIVIPPVAPATSAKPGKPNQLAPDLEAFIGEMHESFGYALDHMDDDFGERFVPEHEVHSPIDYWATVIRNLAIRVRELEAGLNPSQSVAKPAQSDLRCPLCGAPDFGKCPCDAEAVNAALRGETLPNPFLTRDGQAQHVDAGSRLDAVKKMDLLQLRAALQVPKLQGTVRFAVEKRIKKLEAADG